VAVGLLKVAAVSSHRLAEASIILGTHGLKNTIRSLDAIHLATAQALHKRSPIAAFIAADKRLLSVASTACSLTVVEVS
jgi:predicted nucleic acid-binding protein